MTKELTAQEILDSIKDIDFQNFYDSEEKLINPVLLSNGFKIFQWYHGDYDSFGPLSRVVTVEKNGVQSEAWYG